MSEPDFEDLLSELDPRDMAGFTRKFVDDLQSSMSADLGIVEDSDWNGVLGLGMGGSGAGGLFLKALSDDFGGLPFVVWSDYGLPSWWGPEWLVLATSYSGNTEETLDGVREAISAGGTVVGICSGGELEGILSETDDSVSLRVPPGQGIEQRKPPHENVVVAVLGSAILIYRLGVPRPQCFIEHRDRYETFLLLLSIKRRTAVSCGIY